MAEISLANTRAANLDRIVTWATVTESDTFEALDLSGIEGALTIQVDGTFGGATIAIQGSIDGTTYATLTKVDTNAASATAAAVFSLADRPRYIKPLASGGTGQSVNVRLLIEG